MSVEEHSQGGNLIYLQSNKLQRSSGENEERMFTFKILKCASKSRLQEQILIEPLWNIMLPLNMYDKFVKYFV